MSIESIFGHDFLMVNRSLLPVAGRDGVIVLSYLADLSRFDIVKAYAAEHDGYFFLTREKLEEEWQYSDSQQRRIIKELEEKSLIETKLIGCPPKRHIRFNEAALDAATRYVQPKKAPEPPKDTSVFYNELGTSIYEGFDAYRESKDNIIPAVALPLYVFTRLMYTYHKRKLTWNGKMYSQFKAYAVKHNPMDYSQLAEALKSDRVANSKDEYLVYTFREEVKAVPQKHYSKRVEDPAKLPEWNSIRGGL